MAGDIAALFMCWWDEECLKKVSETTLLYTIFLEIKLNSEHAVNSLMRFKTFILVSDLVPEIHGSHFGPYFLFRRHFASFSIGTFLLEEIIPFYCIKIIPLFH